VLFFTSYRLEIRGEYPMTSNNIILLKPNTGEVLSHTINSETSARLQFDSQEIAELSVGDVGQLIVTFTDDSQVVITNFSEFAENGNFLYLEDGTLIDPSILTAAAISPQALNTIDTAAGGTSSSDAITIAQPAANTTQEVALQSGQKYVCEFDPANAATVEVKDGQMVLTFADGSQVVINNYSEVMAGDLPAELTIADGTVIEPDSLLVEATEAETIEEILEIAEESTGEQVANIEPAAGESSVAETLANIEPAAGGDGAVSNSGYGFNSAPVDVPLNSPDAIGPLDPTALRYVAPQFQQDDLRVDALAAAVDDRPIITPTIDQLDETELGVGPLVSTGTVVVDYGNDGPGTITGTGNFTVTCDVAGGSLKSGGVPVVVAFDVGTNTYTGTAGGVLVFTMVVDSVTGDYTYTQNEPFDHADTANDNEPICLHFGLVVEDADGDREFTNITINVLDDAPVVTSQVAVSVDETDFTAGALVTTGQFFTDPGEDVVATFPGNNNFNATGSVDNGALTSNGVAVVVSFDAGTNTYTGVAGGVTVFTMVLDPADGSFTYTQNEPLDHADATDPNDVLTLNFGVDVVDFDGDSESGFVSVNVFDDAPVTGDDTNTIDESNLDTGPIVINDSVSVDFGGDGEGSLLPSGTFAASGSVDNGTLSSGGVPIVVTPTANGYVGVAGSVTVFTLDLNPTTGDYTFTLLESLDHADNTNPNDIITLTFGTEISDFDDDVEPGQIIVNIADDAPTFQPSGPIIDQGLENVDETNLGPIVETGTLTADFGEDTPGTYEGSDSFTPSGSLAGGALTSCGHPVTVTFDSATNTYTGAANGATIFTLAIDPTTGDYTYTQTGALDHADGTDPNDVITLTFGVDAVDSEGEGANVSIVINVADDAPEVEDAYNTVDESDLGPVIVTGDVTHDFGNDHAALVDGFDASGTFTSGGSQLGGALTHNGIAVTVAFDAGTNTYTGAAGSVIVFTMVVNSDGSYTFELLSTLDHADPNDPNDIINLNFGVVVTDKDGDQAEAVIVINVKDDVPTIGNSSGDVDETNFNIGPLVYTDTVDHNTGPNLATIEPNGAVSSSTPLISGGVPVTVSQTGNTYTGTAGGVIVFTLTIDPATGEYTYTQIEPLDHPDSTDPDDVIAINFGIEIETLDGSTADSVITINVADDGPAATDDFNSAEEGQFITGDVRANDDLSQDGDDTGDNTITNVEFNGVNHAVPAGGSVTIVGDYGTLVINSDGTYDYTANSNDPDGTDVFNYILTDRDGDTAEATLSIEVSPDGQPVAVSQLIAVDETNLTPGPMIFNGDLNVDFGIDGAGSVTATNAGSFVAGGSLAGGTLTSGGVPVVVTLSGNTYTGTAGSVTVFTVAINNDGTYIFQLLDHIDHADSTDPNDIITMEFGVAATDSDGDTTTGTFTVHVHDDAPVAYDDGTQTLDEGQTRNGNVLTNDESSEDRPTDVVEVIFNGTSTAVPTTGTVSVTGQYGVLTISAGGTYSYTANGNNPDGTDTFTYVIEDFDGDQDTAEFSFDVSPIDDQPIIVTPTTEVVDETNLSTGPNVETGTINVNYGNDGPGEVNPNNIFSSSEANLTSCGHPVIVTLSGNTYTGTANGVVTFTMEILENGDYTFTQFHSIDHPNTLDDNDSITLNFGATATDADGDTASTTVSVNVLDDGPEIDQVAQQVDEGVLDGGTLTATGTITHDFGQDGAGAITTNGLFEAKFQPTGANVALSSGGNAVTVTNTAGVYTGTANGVVVFTLTIDPATGDYTYQQFEPIDHPDGTDPDDVIWLKFYVDITDKDGDTDTGIIVIDVHDDGPVANNDSRSLEEGQTRSGNIIDNDDVGVDVEGTITQVVFNGTTTNVPTTGTTTVTGQYGVLTISADGTYSYTANSNDPDGTDIFIYTLQDGDGDTDTANLSFNVDPDFDPTNINGSGTTDDTIVDNNGNDVETGTINVNYHGDGPGVTTGRGNFGSDGARTGNTLSHDGVPVNVTFNAGNNTYTGVAGSVTVFTMTINTDGTYRFVQHENLDHSLTGQNNEAIALRFGVTATDSDGDTGHGLVTIFVRDDGPDAVNDTAGIGRFGNIANGNVLTNDDAGADDSSIAVTTPGTYVGSFGTLVLNANGTYAYTRFGRAGGTDTFSYTMRDGDGDTDTAVLRINVIANPIITGDGDGGDGDGGGGGGDGAGSPLVFDLDGDGIELISKEEGVLFDIDLDGIEDQTAWVSADDGLLAIDKNGDGIINDRSELFGDTDGFTDGFDNLSSYDGNNDGVIDVNDEVFDELLIWQDLNSDGVSDQGELLTLAQIGIVSISLNADLPEDFYIEGNWISHVSTYLTDDGQTHDVVDAWFQYDSGVGSTVIEGTSSAYNFIFQAIQESAVDIHNFDVTEDTVDLSTLIQGSDNVTDAINDFVYITEENGSTIISVDVDGADGPEEAVEVARLDNVSGQSLDDLIDSGAIVI
jgi:T1SS-143 domain-containing protein